MITAENIFMSDAYVGYEKREQELKNNEFKDLFQGLYDCKPEDVETYFKAHESEFEKFDRKLGDFDKKVLEPTYKELYKMFREITGHQLRYYGVDYDFFKVMVDENLGYGETPYWFYYPDMEVSFKRVTECWENNKD